MLVRNIGEIAKLEECKPLVWTNVWHRHVEKISDAEWMAIYNLLKKKHGHDKAYLCMYKVVNEALKTFILTNLSACDLLNFAPPPKNFSYGDLIQVLNTMPVMVEACVRLAIFDGIDIDEASALTWQKIKRIRLSSETKQVLDNLPRHFKVNYLFWEYVNKKPTPIYNMQHRVFKITGLRWHDFKLCAESSLLGRNIK